MKTQALLAHCGATCFPAMSKIAFKKSSKSLTFVLCKIMEQILLETLMRHIENREMTGDNQHGFVKDMLCLTNLVAFCGSVTEVVGEERATDVICLDLCRAFGIVSRRLMRH